MEQSVDLTSFRTAYQEYLQFEKSHQIPPKIRDKLVCLAKLAFNQQKEQYSTLDKDQIKLLEQVPLEHKEALFLSVANCLMGKQEIDFVNQRKAYIKKDSFWAGWERCYIMYTKDTFIVNRGKKRQEIQFKGMIITSKVKKSKKRFVFMFEYHRNQYKIGFENQNVAIQYRDKFKKLINKANKINKVINVSPHKQQIQNTTQFQKQSEVPSDIESQDNNEYLQEFQVQNIEDQNDFKIIEHTENGRIMIHKQNSHLFKIFMVVEQSDPSLVLEAFMKIQEWNSQVSSHKIVNRLQQNCYVVYENHKSTGYLTRPRDYVLLKLALKRKKRYLLLQKSVTHPDYPQYKLSVRGCINRKVTAFLPHPTNNKLILLISQIDIDFKGYINISQDTQSQMLKYLKSYEKFSKYLIQKSFLNSTRRLFDFDKKHDVDKVIFEAIRSCSIIEPSSNNIKNQVVKISLQQQFKNLIPKDEYVQLTDRYIQLVKMYVNHYHCINHRYSQGKDQNKMLKHTKNEIIDTILLGDWKLTQTGQVQFINQKAIAAQKDVIKYILKQIGTNILKGKSIMNMSLPVDIFDNKSLLERIMGSYGYVPIFVTKAAQSIDQVEQIKLCSIFCSTINILQMKLEKPFNPILGQTFQGYIGGIPIYIEQISHHPPISAIYMQSTNFKIYGNLQARVEMGLNSLTGYNVGIIHIQFKSNNTHFQCTLPAMQLTGVVSGTRKYKVINKLSLMERKKGIYCQVSFGKDKKDVYVSKDKMKQNQVIGGVFRVSQNNMNRLYNEIKNQTKYNGINKKDIIEKIGQISGTWSGTMFIDGEVIKSLYDPMPYHICYSDYPLPSDSNFRQDLLYRRIGNYAQSQLSKQKLQNIQRNDRKLRGKKH